MQQTLPSNIKAPSSSSTQGMRRVVVFVPRFPNITETFIEREISGLADLPELNVKVFAIEHGKGHLSENLKEKLVVKKLTLSRFLSVGWGFLATLTGSVRKSLEVLDMLIKHDSSVSVFYKTFLWLRIVAFYVPEIRKLRPDFILAHFMSEPSTVILGVAHILNIPFGISAHARDIFEHAQYPRLKLRNASFITICNSKAYNRYLEISQASATPEFLPKVSMRYHGINIKDLEEAYSKCEEPSQHMLMSKNEGKFVLFNNARLSAKKGHDYLIEAVNILKAKGIPVVLYILAGGGTLIDETKKKINELGLLGDVDILHEGKGVPFDQILKYYKGADAYIFPSLDLDSGDAEGIANTLIEAAIFKIPVVATKAGAIADFLTHGTSALLVPQRDSSALAVAIEALYKDTNLRATLTANAYPKALAMFDGDSRVGELGELITKATPVL